MKRPPPGLEPSQAWAWFPANGISISEWCRYYNLNRYTVVDLLRGNLKGHRGGAHRAAILLGLKPDPDQRLAA